ncbi:MAG: hypothetical protein CMO01_29435 [Thalassobius sp.]|nr:hypothetical protein [Thalassovita sp.]
MKDVENYLNAMPAEKYILQLWHKEEDIFRPIRKILSKEELLNHINFLKAKNCQGYNIYCRPDEYCYILLDDLSKEVLGKLAELKPCLLMETSPGNYQAFIRLVNTPNTRENVLAICRALADQFRADRGAAKPEQVGRLPGFTNRKEKHNVNGKYPFVKLHKYQNRFSTYQSEVSRHGRSCANIEVKTPSFNKAYDRSRRDFAMACNAIRQNKSDREIYEILVRRSEKIRGSNQKRIDSYIRTTIKNARRALQGY